MFRCKHVKKCSFNWLFTRPIQFRPLKSDERIKTWQLFAIISNFVNFESKFQPYLLNFLYNAYYSEKESVIVKNYTAFAIVNFVKNQSLNDRHLHPLVNDIKNIIVN